ncbi:TolC family protein [Sphingomonas pseudosanguinis]|uniref:Cobalt-zinc-cadmium efflux system outer membrane protein n=1 Tax=Sphingomonas pseudosanguinis TaxID=413712 RepID=A0A7W6ABP4_9SPHN|nr:TolC family protein [Sphingomonas pseudosanguinis]MBB3880924.1 cobalt-zinc-cadmium efflux system outer membrane protein [Sphingomonas pseudosanguinis]MBN3535787.1 TolC family protein [Sphingomonas pseudosanguinis]
MKMLLAALLAAASCATVAQAQTGVPVQNAPTGPVYTLDQAVAAAGGSAPASEAATAAVQAAQAGRTVAGLRPNPVVQGQIENIIGSGPYRGLRSAESTVGFAVPIELGGKRGARVAVANAQLSRAEIQAAIIAADVRLQVTQLYVEAVAAERRVVTARDQARIASDALRGASVRVQAGRASPLEQQRADVARINADANVERQLRLAEAARANLARRIGRPVDGTLDDTLLDQLPGATVYGPMAPVETAGTLALAAANADFTIAEAGVRLARANRVPDLNVGPALRRLEATNDTAAVFTVSIPIPLFNNGRAAIAQATAQRTQADAQRRVTALDIEQAITDAQAQAANAATTARAASGPALAAAQEAARIARIGYREGKFGQLELLDAERTLAETRVAAIDALANYQNARAQVERLTARAPNGGNQ